MRQALSDLVNPLEVTYSGLKKSVAYDKQTGFTIGELEPSAMLPGWVSTAAPVDCPAGAGGNGTAGSAG